MLLEKNMERSACLPLTQLMVFQVVSYHTHIPHYIPQYTWDGLVEPMWKIIRFCTLMADLTLVPSNSMKVDNSKLIAIEYRKRKCLSLCCKTAEVKIAVKAQNMEISICRMPPERRSMVEVKNLLMAFLTCRKSCMQTNAAARG